MELNETLEKKIKTNIEKMAPIAAPLSWAAVIGNTYFYLYCTAKNYHSSADYFLAWDIVMIPFVLMYTAVLARRYRSKPEEPKNYVRISGEE